MLQTPIFVSPLGEAATEFDLWGDQGCGRFRDLFRGPVGDLSSVIMQLCMVFALSSFQFNQPYTGASTLCKGPC